MDALRPSPDGPYADHPCRTGAHPDRSDTAVRRPGSGLATYPRSVRSQTLPRVGTALLVSVLAGLLVAGLAFPVVGGVALAAKAGSDDFLELPAGFTDERIALFMALDLEPCESGAQSVEEEHMVIEKVALDDVDGFVQSGRIADAKTIIGLLLAKDLLQ